MKKKKKNQRMHMWNAWILLNNPWDGKKLMLSNWSNMASYGDFSDENLIFCTLITSCHAFCNNSGELYDIELQNCAWESRTGEQSRSF